MPIDLYMDVHIPDSIARGLHARNVDVLTAQEDGWRRADDPDLLARATVLNRVLFPFDDDFSLSLPQLFLNRAYR